MAEEQRANRAASPTATTNPTVRAGPVTVAARGSSRVAMAASPMGIGPEASVTMTVRAVYRKGNGGGFRRGDRDFHRDGDGEGQERRSFRGGPRKFSRDGERRNDRRGGYRGGRGNDGPRYQRDGERSRLPP